LLVTIHRASDLVPRDIDKRADPYVKVSIPGKSELGVTEVRNSMFQSIHSPYFRSFSYD
jgi:hypothetical protein